METLQMLRKGADPATLIDPDTGKPVVPGPRPTAVREKAPAAAAPPPPEPARSSAPSPTSSIPTLPEGISVDAKEMILVAAGSFLSEKTASSPSDKCCRPPVG
jgi:hypothetical protein